jgi:hypothetical protein
MAYRLAGGVINGLISAKYDFTTHIIIAIVNISLMILLLQIKKNGVSAWSIIFKKNKPSANDEKSHDNLIFGKEVATAMSKPEIEDGNITINPTEEFGKCDDNKLPEENANAKGIVNEGDDVIIESNKVETLSDEKTMEEHKQAQKTRSENVSLKPNDKVNSKSSLKIGRWWIFLLIVVVIITIVVFCVWQSNQSRKGEPGKYVYVDNYSILHVDRNCDNIAVFHGARPVTIYSINEFTRENWKKICSSCISDEKYESINKILIINENRNLLYKTLVEEGCEMGEFSEFANYIENKKDQEWCYEKLKEKGYIMQSYESYAIQMGFNNKKDVAETIEFPKRNARVFYDSIKPLYYDLPSFEQFSKDIEDSLKRRQLYNDVKDKYYIPSFENFTQYLLDDSK